MKLLLCFLLSAFCFSARAATTWVVAPSGGQSTTINGIWSQNIQPGDTVEVRAATPGGVQTYYEQVEPTKSGTAGNPILLTARAGDFIVIDAQLTRNDCVLLDDCSYLTLRGFYTTNAISYSVRSYGTSTGITIQGNHVHASFGGTVNLNRNAICCAHQTSLVVESNTVTQDLAAYETGNDTDGINLADSTYTTVRYNNVTLSALTVNDGAHDDCLQFWDCQHMYIYNNIFFISQMPASRRQGIFGQGETAGMNSDWQVYNNLVYGYAGTYLINLVGQADPVVIQLYNNTVDAWYKSGGPGMPLQIDGTGSIIKNNIFMSEQTYTANCGYYEVVPASASQIDYNLYYNPNNNSSSEPLQMGSSAKTWAQWKAAGYDAHGLNVNPNVSAAYVLQSGSPAIGAGVNLSSIFTTDLTGAARTGAWDMGAYSASGQSQRPAAPIIVSTVPGP
jgi:hypothetical protein